MKITITGGTGFLGRHLTEYLKSMNHEITYIQRSDLREGVERISKLIKSSDVLINLAGSPVIKRWTDQNKKEILRSRIGTTSLLVEALLNLSPSERPSCLISASAIGIYKSDQSHTEQSVNFETNFLAEVCQEWERTLQPLAAVEIRKCIVRIGIVLGKDGGMLKQLLPLFKLALGGKIGSGKQPFSFIHSHDFCRAIHFLCENQSCEGIYNLTAPEVSSNGEFTRKLASACRRPALFTIPEFALRLIYGEAAVAMIKGQGVYPQHLLEDGFQFVLPDLDSTIRELLG